MYSSSCERLSLRERPRDFPLGSRTASRRPSKISEASLCSATYCSTASKTLSSGTERKSGDFLRISSHCVLLSSSVSPRGTEYSTVFQLFPLFPPCSGMHRKNCVRPARSFVLTNMAIAANQILMQLSNLTRREVSGGQCGQPSAVRLKVHTNKSLYYLLPSANLVRMAEMCHPPLDEGRKAL